MTDIGEGGVPLRARKLPNRPPDAPTPRPGPGEPPGPDLIAELLRLPHRSQTVLPELIAFFEKTPDELARFLREFSGTVFEVPGPNLWTELQRDEQIGRMLLKNASVERQIEICLRERITYPALAGIYQVVSGGRRLPPPPSNGTTAGRIEAAKELQARFPKAAKLIREMYGLLGKAK